MNDTIAGRHAQELPAGAELLEDSAQPLPGTAIRATGCNQALAADIA
jgi:hypothetical protein